MARRIFGKKVVNKKSGQNISTEIIFKFLILLLDSVMRMNSYKRIRVDSKNLVKFRTDYDFDIFNKPLFGILPLVVKLET